MAGINTVTLSGRLAKDPESRNAGEHIVVSFPIAVDGYAKDAPADFFDCECWNKTAEFVGEYLKKGSFVVLTGRLKLDRWEQDGKTNYRVKVVATQVEAPKISSAPKDEKVDLGGGESINLSEIPF